MKVVGIKRFYIFDNNSTAPMLPELLPLVKVRCSHASCISTGKCCARRPTVDHMRGSLKI